MTVLGYWLTLMGAGYGTDGLGVGGNFFIYQARECSLVPAGFLAAHFLQKKRIYEAFVVMGELR